MTWDDPTDFLHRGADGAAFGLVVFLPMLFATISLLVGLTVGAAGGFLAGYAVGGPEAIALTAVAPAPDAPSPGSR